MPHEIAGIVRQRASIRTEPITTFDRRPQFLPRLSAAHNKEMMTSPSRARGFVLACVVLASVVLGGRDAQAQGRDPLLNGTVIGAAVGAASGVALTHAVRDSDLGFTQYAYGALIFGAMGAGAGLGIDALLYRSATVPGTTPRPVTIAPVIWRNVTGVLVKWRW